MDYSLFFLFPLFLSLPFFLCFSSSFSLSLFSSFSSTFLSLKERTWRNKNINKCSLLTPRLTNSDRGDILMAISNGFIFANAVYRKNSFQIDRAGSRARLPSRTRLGLARLCAGNTKCWSCKRNTYPFAWRMSSSSYVFVVNTSGPVQPSR